MSENVRSIALIGGIGAVVAGALASPLLFPTVFASEPQKHLLASAETLFPPPFDPSQLKKFAITFGDSVSTEPQSTQTVSKIGFGHKSVVSIVTTTSGTYSSDGIASPHVLYPGIDVALKHPNRSYWTAIGTAPEGGTWSSYGFTVGSITYLNVAPAART
jgi:hypothetical protein